MTVFTPAERPGTVFWAGGVGRGITFDAAPSEAEAHTVHASEPGQPDDVDVVYGDSDIRVQGLYGETLYFHHEMDSCLLVLSDETRFARTIRKEQFVCA